MTNLDVVDIDPRTRDFLIKRPSLLDKIIFNLPTIRAARPSILVGDVSHWNEIDWEQLRASGLQAVIIKCSEGSEGSYYEFKDPEFERNWRSALDLGFPVMLYHFFRDAKGSAEKSWHMKCADAFLNDPRINGKTASWLDVEWTGSGLSTSARAARAFGYCDLIKGEGMREGIYSSPGLVSQLFPPNDPRWQNVNGWVAHWTPYNYTLPSGWTHDMIKGHQFGIYDDHWWTPEVTGAGDIDLNNFFFASEEELRDWMGQVIAPPPPPAHGHEALQLQIDAIRTDVAKLYANDERLEEVDLDHDALITALTLDVTDINGRIQDASDALQGGGE